ncbi:septal ring lytic transglycosylase RlpA family protein [Glaciecola siphonariae]|uniref:Endolytic peptidoglycan transglycosylase RlpA n=1 Tax=Glaciecola siphonariae TaxID=521012 RepID=A0ABV9LRE1_9ALTE
MFRLEFKRVLILSACLIFMQACSTAPTGRYTQKQDSAPQFEYGELSFVEPIPVYEPYSVWTSRPYTVLGGYYTPMLDAKGFEDTGYASWYGQKFHGHTTANGETFDMFALTAAHKTLPLPSFLRVTNLENNKTATVRVNDRGPFHDDRILDLSYGAAKKLGFHSKGVTKVKIEVIHVSPSGVVTIGKSAPTNSMLASTQKTTATNTVNAKNQVVTSTAASKINQSLSTTEMRINAENSPDINEESLQDTLLFVQVTASSNESKVRELATGLSNLLQVTNSIPKLNDIYRLHLGPMENEQSAQKLIQDLQKIGFENAFQVEFNPQ